VCSWSLKPGSPADLVRKVQQCGLRDVQLALDPLRDGRWPLERTVEALAAADITVRSGMIGMSGEDYSTPATIRQTGGVRLDARWDEHLAAATASAALAWRLRLPLVSFHAGFVPHERRDPLRAVMLGRLRAIADVFAEHGVALALETGQERADTLLDALAELDRATVGVNFDPANMLLYGMGDPVAALAALGPHVRQVHVKDARSPRQPGTWGEEVAAGSGEVNWPAFFEVLARVAPRADLMIEREAGTERVADIRTAATFVRAQLGAESVR
jgi:L-ribulose-5-phosphate 3-epimerase